MELPCPRTPLWRGSMLNATPFWGVQHTVHYSHGQPALPIGTCRGHALPLVTSPPSSLLLPLLSLGTPSTVSRSKGAYGTDGFRIHDLPFGIFGCVKLHALCSHFLAAGKHWFCLCSKAELLNEEEFKSFAQPEDGWRVLWILCNSWTLDYWSESANANL